MDIRFQCLGPDQWKAEILIVPVCQGENMLEACPALDNLAPWLAIAPAMRESSSFTGAAFWSRPCCTAIPNCACRAYWPSAWAPVKT